MVAITLPDGSRRTFDGAVSAADVAAAIGPGLAKAALAAKIDGALRDLSHRIERDASISIVTAKDADGIEIMRHDCAHVLAEAVKELYPETQVTIGPVIEDGFYYDFARPTPFTPEDLAKIEARMKSSIATKPSRARNGPRRDPLSKVSARLKAQLIEAIPPIRPSPSIARAVVDLPRPHLPSTSSAVRSR